jgi:hypothetical protein
MWVLSPVVATAAAAGQTTQAGNKEIKVIHDSHFLTGTGDFTIGRPAKGSEAPAKAAAAPAKAAASNDIVLRGDNSISKLHATLTLAPAAAPGERPAVTVTGVL